MEHLVFPFYLVIKNEVMIKLVTPKNLVGQVRRFDTDGVAGFFSGAVERDNDLKLSIEYVLGIQVIER